MCRFALYLGPAIRMSALITDPEHSIIHQSVNSREREEPLNGDGFGVAWYDRDIGPEPGVFKDVSPAWNNPNLRNLARMISSRCMLAHVRAATPGLPVHHLNCHPFRWKTIAMMHNGEVHGFARVKRALRNSLADDVYDWVLGSTDSEHLFGLFVQHYEAGAESDPGDRLARALAATIAQLNQIRAAVGVTEPAFLNLAVTDGEYAAVSRYVSDPTRPPHSLYLYEGEEYHCENGVCQLSPPAGEAPPAMVIIASEPVSVDVDWQAVPPQHIAIVRAGEPTRWTEIP